MFLESLGESLLARFKPRLLFFNTTIAAKTNMTATAAMRTSPWHPYTDNVS